MTNEKRKEIKETFASLEEMLSQTGSAESIATAPKFKELVAKAKDCLHEFDEKGYVDSCFSLDIAKAIDAIENCQSEIKGERNGDEWLNTARERIRRVNDRLKDWADCCTKEKNREWDLPMIDLSTASSEEIIAEAKKVLALLRNNKQLPTEVALDLTEWLFAFGIRLMNDVKGVQRKSEEEIDEEVKRLVKSLE